MKKEKSTAWTHPDYLLGDEIALGLRTKVSTAKRRSDGAWVVVKSPKSSPPTKEEIDALKHEHKILQLLQGSPFVPEIYDFITSDNPPPSLIVEKIDAPPVAELFRGKAPLPLEEFFPFALAALQALEAIHKCDVVHRDFTEHNLLYDRDKQLCRAVDFSLSANIDRQKTLPRNPELMEGTLAYISPEQTGRMNRGTDYRTDFYAYGILLFRALTGEYPFVSDDLMEVVYSHLAVLPISPSRLESSIPEVLSDIVLKLLAKDADERYQSIAGIRYDLVECQKRMKEGIIAPFAIAGHDTFERFIIPDKIYGRDREISLLVDAYEEVIGGASGLLFIGGYSGVGKSSLIQELYDPIIDREGRICTGKFDQFRRNIPYHAFYQAFDEYVQQMLRESDENLAAFKERVQKALGTIGQVIVDAVPRLEVAIGKQPPLPAIGVEETLNRFNYAFQRFVECLATPEKPLVLFLDDLQWADSPSLRMLETLIEHNLPYLLIIGGYRDNEVDEWHALTILQNELRRREHPFALLSLKPLTLSCLQQMIEETLLKRGEAVAPLAKICMEKTNGNPFFAKELLRKLQSDALIRYDWESAQWQYDSEAIAKAPIADNVVELMVERIRALPKRELALLQKAACIGNRFSYTLLEKLFDEGETKVREGLDELLKCEYIFSLEENYFSAEKFRFAHDRIQQAAHDLLGIDERVELHLTIAKCLEELQREGKKEEKARLLSIVDHYNYALESGHPITRDTEERRRLAALNLEALKRAKEGGAQEVALDYKERALSWIGSEDWENERLFLIDLYGETMEAAFLAKKFSLVEEIGALIAVKRKNPFEGVKAATLLSEHYMNHGRFAEAAEGCIAALEELGIFLPRKPGKLQVVKAILTPLYALWKKGLSIEELAKLPKMEGEKERATLELLKWAVAPYIVSGDTDFLSVGLSTLFSYVIENGNSTSTPSVFAAYGIILSSLGALESGYRLGRVAKELTDLYPDPKERGKVIHIALFYTLFWKDNWKEQLPLYQKTYEQSFECGNYLIVSNAQWVKITLSFYTSQPLPKLLVSIETVKASINSLKNRDAIFGVEDFEAAGATLASEGEEAEKMAKREEVEGRTDLSKAVFFPVKLMTHYLLRDFPEALHSASQFGKVRQAILSSFHPVIFDFYHAMTLAALYREASCKERLRTLATISATLLQFKKYARLAPENLLHYYLLLKAERARILGRRRKAAILYEKAAAAAKNEEIFAVEALANELAARFYLEEGRESIAALFLEKALRCYEQWGAKRKVALLNREFETLLGKELEKEEEKRGEEEGGKEQKATKTVTIAVAAGKFDVAAMRRSGEVIASTILMKELQMKLMNLVMQHGGAERGLLIMARDGEYLIEAESSRRSAETRLLHGEKMNDKMLPLTIVKEVIRNKKELVLEDAIRDDNYKGDPYIKRARIRSLLFAPLLNNNKIAAILYLENNLSKNSFTEERCEMINFLSSQLAMAIDNAKLYEGTLALSEAYERFVPKDFISLLGKERILDIALGDHREREMSVLFTDIRNFTSMSEAMTPKENFTFINEFLGYMEPVIRNYRGFIDKYIGDAIMALFPGKADDAVGCGIAMLEALKELNSAREKRGDPPIEIGIGINSGLLILGTVGSALRMDGTVISDAVNIASRVEHLTKEYGTPLLITEESVQRLSDKSSFPLAAIGETPIRGKSKKITLYTIKEDVRRT